MCWLIYIVNLTQPKLTSQIRLTCGHDCDRLFWLIIDMGGLSPLWTVLPYIDGYGLWKKAIRESQRASEYTLFLSRFCFHFFWHSCPQFSQWWIVIWNFKTNKLLPPVSCFYSWCLPQQQKTKYDTMWMRTSIYPSLLSQLKGTWTAGLPLLLPWLSGHESESVTRISTSFVKPLFIKYFVTATENTKPNQPNKINKKLVKYYCLAISSKLKHSLREGKTVY